MSKISFRSWYEGNYFTRNGVASSVWATDGRILVRTLAVRNAKARAFIEARQPCSGIMDNGNEKGAHVVASACLEPGEPFELGMYESPGEKRTGRHLMVLRHGEQILAYEACAYSWLLRHVAHTRLAIGSHGELWLVDSGSQQALLMPMCLPDPAAILAHFQATARAGGSRLAGGARNR